MYVFPHPVAPYAIIVELKPSRMPSMKWERDSSYIYFVVIVWVKMVEYIFIDEVKCELGLFGTVLALGLLVGVD